MKLISLILPFLLIFEQSAWAQAAGSIDLSRHFANFGQAITQTDKFRPLHLRYISYDSQSHDFKPVVGLQPSPPRLVEYATVASSSPAYEDERDKLIGLCADILRNDGGNEKLPATEPGFKNFLTALESDRLPST